MAVDLRERADGRTGWHRPDPAIFADPWAPGGPLWDAELDGADLVEVPPAWVRDGTVEDADPDGSLLIDPDAQIAALADREGAGLAALLAMIDPRTVDTLHLDEVAAAARRVESWAHAVLARIAGEMAARSTWAPDWPTSVGVQRQETASDELAIRLNLGRQTARSLVDEGVAYRTYVQATGEALRDGRIDPPRARVLVDRLREVDGFTAAEVEHRVLPGAPDRTVAQLRRDVDRALLEVDPDGGALRRTRSRADRRVSRPKPLADGLAGLWAVLPAEDAARLDRNLDASARALRALRARGDRRSHAQLRADALVDAVMVGPAWAVLMPEHVGSAPEDPAPSRMPPRAEVRVTVALSTLLGMDEQPADLDGYGPIDATTARALAAGGTWRRLVTDPLTGAVLDVGRSRYRPPADLAAHVIARDRTCARPGCTVPASACDLDHTVPWNDGGTTTADNLGPLCRRDHLLKTHGGHRLEQPAPGEFIWTTPRGTRVRSVPGRDGEHSRLPRVALAQRIATGTAERVQKLAGVDAQFPRTVGMSQRVADGAAPPPLGERPAWPDPDGPIPF